MGLTSSSTGNFLNKTKQKSKENFDFIVGLAGNPNVGKSTIFNCLTGMHQHTGNWPGKTVSNASGYFKYKHKNFKIFDIPGTYSLMSNSEEEEIARDFICNQNPDVTIVVVDSTCLERSLNLVYQIMEITKNIIVCVNLLDEAEKKGIQIDLDKLSEMLGVPVVGTIANKKKTLLKLQETAYLVCSKQISISPKVVTYPADIEEYRKNNMMKEYNNGVVSTIFSQCSTVSQSVTSHKSGTSPSKSRKIDKILTSKKFGIPIMLLFFALILWITIVGANYPSQWLSTLFGYIQEKLIIGLEAIYTPSYILNPLVFGVYQTTTWVISVMFPPMAIFFPIFTLLEDLGFLPRIAFNLDRCFKKCCTCGKQALTMCMGFGCNAAGVVGCRIIDSKREKIIAMLTNTFVPCNGRFPFLITLSMIFIGSYFSGIFSSIAATLTVLLIIILGIFFTFIISNILSKTLLKGKSTNFILELPPYRKPQVRKIIIRSIFDRALFVLARSIAVAAPAGLLIWLFANIQIGDLTILGYIATALDPFASLMGLDGYILAAFLLGLPANEIVLPLILMSYLGNGSLVSIEDIGSIGEILKANGWTIITAINSMIFCLLHFPCSTTLLSIKKESGSIKWALLGFAIPTACGIILCICTNFIYNLVI